MIRVKPSDCESVIVGAVSTAVPCEYSTIATRRSFSAGVNEPLAYDVAFVVDGVATRGVVAAMAQPA
jgi:hypothetical protein